MRKAHVSLSRSRLVPIGRSVGIGLVGFLLVVTALSVPSRPAAAAKRRAKMHHLEIVAEEFSFEMRSRVLAGWTAITLRNEGIEEHQAQVARIKDGVTVEQLRDVASRGDPGALVPLVIPMGGPNAVAPGGHATTVDRLEPGPHVVICFVFSEDGVEHDAKGMLMPFTVTKARGATRPPAATATIVLRDFSFDIPEGLGRTGFLAVRNAGTQAHEMALVRLDPGKTVDDAKAYLLVPPGTPPPIPPPGAVIGGIVGIEPGTTAYVKLGLKPADYVAICFFGDAAKGGLPHALEGMIEQFTVS